MKSSIQIQDLEANYLADIENSTLARVYGGGGFFDGLGDAVKEIYAAGKDLGSSIVRYFEVH